MIRTRRHVLGGGGGILAALALGPLVATADDAVDIVMAGKADGSHVWFDPIGLHVQPGQTIRWTNRDPGNVHTATAYDPSVLDRPRRIPEGAVAWNSDYLLPNDSFAVTLTVEGVYDYYCMPHEQAGMVGRIVVGIPPIGEPPDPVLDAALMPLPEAALKSFPAVADILAKGIVHRR